MKRLLCSQTMAGLAVMLVLTADAGVADASFLSSCTTYCHGLPPRDGVRKANPHFDSQSSAFLGNHARHLPAAPGPTDCNVCHTPVTPTDYGHQNGVINMRNSLKGYSAANIRAKYDKGLFVNQTSIPSLVSATCSNASCHFEAKSPAWGGAVSGCAACHGAPPAGSGSHTRHSAYFTGVTGCQKCHPVYSTFSHASSAGRVLRVNGYLKDPLNAAEPTGTYSGAGTNYFPSQGGSRLAFGNCSNLYCHSSGQSATGLGAGTTVTTVNWGSGALNCGSCHGDMATDAAGTGSHQLHATATASTSGAGVNYTCQVCHGINYSRSSAPAGSTHVNRSIDLAFTTISGAVGAGTVYSKVTPFASGSAAYGYCSNSACHGGAAVTKKWGVNTANPLCFKCHGSNSTTGFSNVSAASVAPGGGTNGRDLADNTAATSPRVGAHQTHLTAADNISSPIHCGECHTTHLTVKDATHLNFTTATITFGPLAKNAGHSPTVSRSAGVISCSGTYCHAGKLNSGSSMTPAWVNTGYIPTTISVAGCGNCHGFPPATSTGHPAATTPAGFPVGSNCSCHANLSATGTTYANIFVDKTKHINGSVEATSHSWPYPGATHGSVAGAAPYSACTGCHTNWNAVANTYPFTRGDATQVTCKTCHKGSTFNTASQGCADCHGDSTGRPSSNTSVGGNVFPNISGSHGKHVVVKGFGCSTCHATYGTGSVNHGSSGGQLSQQTIAFVHVTSATGQFGDFTYTKKDHTTAGKGSCANNACHGLAEWGVDKLDCISCHSAPVAIANGPLTGQSRAAVAASLKTSGTRNHKSSAVGADASKWDCIVCHMEGDTSTGATSSTIGSVPGKPIHGDGVIDFRDPDTGTQVKKVAWSGPAALGNGTGRYIDTLTNFTTAHFERNLAVTLDADPQWLKIATIQQNLCLRCHDGDGAKSTLAQTKAITSTALQPFGNAVTNTATMYFVNAANKTAAGNTSSSVMNVFSMFSTGNASYHPVMGRQNNGFARAANMKAPWNGGTAAKTNTVYGYLISCFDCHAPQGAGIGSSSLLTGTVVAHGNTSTSLTSAMMRGPSTRVQATVATPNLCTYCHADTYATITSGHGASSALASGPQSMSATTFGTCGNCHTGNIDAPGARAVGAHGADLTETGLSQWPTTNSRPYAFWRGSNVTYWGPGSCSLTNLTGGTCTTQTYTPGGLY